MTNREKAVARFYEKGTPYILAVTLLLTAIGLYFAGGLKLDSELQRLLPGSAKSVQGLERLEEAYGREIGRIAIVVQGPNPQANVAAVDTLTAKLRTLETAKVVEARRPVEFFKQRRLMYLELEDARTVSDKIEERIKWEKSRANPLFVGLDSDEPPEVDLEEIEEKYKSRFDNETYLTDQKRRHFAIFVEPTFPSTDFKGTGGFIDAVNAHFEREIAPTYRQVELTYTGRYVKFFEQQKAVQTDLTRGTAIALVGILLFLLVYFQSWLYPLIIATPLIASTIWSFGWAQIVFGSLNILTGFVGAVLMGLGIDYGIHIVSSFQESRRGHTPKEALITALETAGRPSLYAGLTTLAGLGSLAYSSFRAFFEFGILALGGLTLILLSYAFVLPCLLLLVADTSIEPDPRMPRDTDHKPVTPEQRRWWSRFAKIALTGLGVLAIVGMPGVSFQSDFRELMPEDLPAFQVEDTVEEIAEMARPPAVVLVEDKAHALKVQRELQRRMDEHPDGDILKRIVSIYDFVPDEQEEKLAIWKGVLEGFEDVPNSRLKKNERLGDFHDELKTVVEGGTIAAEDLPASIRRRFARADAPQKSVVLIQPAHYIHDAVDALTYVDVTDELPGPTPDAPTVTPISQEALLADILAHVQEDTVYLLLIAIGGLLLIAWLAFGDLRHMVLAIGTVSAGVTVGTGVLGLLGVPFNFMNMIIWPIWFGLGVDAVFHLSNRVDKTPWDWDGFRHTAGAVFAAFFTTMIGFSGLMISRHRGLESLGQVAVVGLASILAVALAVYVFFLQSASGNEQPDEKNPEATDSTDRDVST